MLLFMGAAQGFAGASPDLLVKLASEGDAGYLGAGLSETIASLQSKSQAAFPGSAASFLVQLKNVGDQAGSFVIRGTGSGNGFTVRCDEAGVDRTAALPGGFTTRVLSPEESLFFLVQVTPAALQLGVSFRVTIGAARTGDPDRVIDQVKTETVACGSSAAVTVSAPPDGSGAPGTAVNYPYTVTNVGNAGNSFTLSVPGPADWGSEIYADDGAGGGIARDNLRQPGETTRVNSTGLLAPGASFRFFVEVTIPPGSANGARADTSISVSGAEGASGADKVTTSAITASISVAESVRNLTQGGVFAPSASALPGDTLEYRMAVTNAGSAPASSVGIRSAVPASTACLPASLWIGTSATGAGSACAAAQCGWVRESGGSIVAHLGEGVTEAAGGSLPSGTTLYVYFRVQVE